MRAWRWPARLAIVGALVAGVAVDTQIDGPEPEAIEVQPPILIPEPVAGDNGLTSTWFCPTLALDQGEFTSSIDGTLILSNLGAEVLDVVVTYYSPSARAVTVVVDVGPGEVLPLEIDERIGHDRVAAVVEAVGSSLAVSRELTSDLGTDLAACATSAATDWIVAAGDTQRDAAHRIQIFNPFPDDAVIDIVFATEAESGPFVAADLQTAIVPGASVISLDIGEAVRRRDVVSTRLVARSGGVIVDRVQEFSGSEGRFGFEVALGIGASATQWFYPALVLDSGTRALLHVYNPNELAAEIDVAAFSDVPFAGGDPIGLTVAAKDTLVIPVVVAGSIEDGIRIEVDAGVPVGLVVESANGVGVGVDIELVVDFVEVSVPTTTTTSTTTTAVPTTTTTITVDTSSETAEGAETVGSTTTTPPTATSTTTTSVPATTTTTTTTTTGPPEFVEVPDPVIVRDLRAQDGSAVTPLVARRSPSWLAIGHTDLEIVSSVLIYNPTTTPADVVLGRTDGTAIEILTIDAGASVVRPFPTATLALLVDADASVIVGVQAERLGQRGVALTSAIPLR